GPGSGGMGGGCFRGGGRLILAPNPGGVAMATGAPTPSARPGSLSSRGTPILGSPKSCMAVLGTLAGEQPRPSMPAGTRPPNIRSGTLGPYASWTLSGVYSTHGVATWSSKPPQSSHVSRNTVSSQLPACTTASTTCQMAFIP